MRVLALGLSLIAAPAAHAQPLPSLTLDPDQTTVSGLSSGGAMAVQVQVAFSGGIAGAGVVAGVPYGCADGSAFWAIWGCMKDIVFTPTAIEMIDEITKEGGDIDPAEGISSDRIYLFRGGQDDTVKAAAMVALEDAYELLGVAPDAVETASHPEVGHAFVYHSDEPDCGAVDDSYLTACDFDMAGDILGWLYGSLSGPSDEQDQHLMPFDQSAYTDGAGGMDDMAYVYVPADCTAGETCRLHIALHGCQQGQSRIGTDYVARTGYNRWAEANRIVVLYPQVKASWWPYNPKGCWDWWGYAGSDYLSQQAPQIAAIARMSAALGAPLD